MRESVCTGREDDSSTGPVTVLGQPSLHALLRGSRSGGASGGVLSEPSSPSTPSAPPDPNDGWTNGGRRPFGLFLGLNNDSDSDDPGAAGEVAIDVDDDDSDVWDDDDDDAATGGGDDAECK